MANSLDERLIEVGYFLSRLGKKDPPHQLQSESWNDAYSKFYSTFGEGKTEEEFRNSLKNLRDHFDSHLDNARTGWMEGDKNPQKLSSANQEVFDRLGQLSDEELWNRIRPLAAISFSLTLAKDKKTSVQESGGKFFSSEFSGKRKLTERNSSEAVVLHGLVVDNLKQFVEANFEFTTVFNTQKVDLAIELQGKVTALFEVKTKTDTQSIYAAVGQLFMHSVGLLDVMKVIVLPESFDNQETIECLAELDIQRLPYLIEGNQCIFQLDQFAQ